MVEYWFCMSAQSAQKKWDACKQARKSQPCKATPVITLRQRDTTTVGNLAELNTGQCGKKWRLDHHGTALVDSLPASKRRAEPVLPRS